MQALERVKQEIQKLKDVFTEDGIDVESNFGFLHKSYGKLFLKTTARDLKLWKAMLLVQYQCLLERENSLALGEDDKK